MKNLATAIFLAIGAYTAAGRKLQAVDDLVWGGVAQTLTSGECGNTDTCTECRESWYPSDPTNKVDRCKDSTVMKYRNKCNDTKTPNLCMSDPEELCHWSFPATDNKHSEQAACRTLPQSYNNQIGS